MKAPSKNINYNLMKQLLTKDLTNSIHHIYTNVTKHGEIALECIPILQETTVRHACVLRSHTEKRLSDVSYNYGIYRTDIRVFKWSHESCHSREATQ